MQLRKVLVFLFIILIILSNTALVSTSAEAAGVNAAQPQTNGKAAVLMDASSGRVLYEKNSHDRLPQASLTKIMTALLVIENGDLNKEVTVSENAANTPECSIYLEPGETLTRLELLYGAMLHSGNDAAMTLAESVSGNELSFVKLINQRARQLEMNDTHFCNPHGLEAAGHYSSAYDLALLSRKALANQVFAQVVGTKQKLIPWAGHNEDRVLINMNRLLYRYDGTIGVKTGYTKEAGNCVVGAARKGDMVLVAVSMNSTAVYDDLQQMLDYGFENYQMLTLGKIDEISFDIKVMEGESKTIAAAPAEDLRVAVTPAEIPGVCYSIVPPAQVTAPLEKGSALGVFKLYIDGKQVAAIDLLASESVNKKVPNKYLASLGQSMIFLLTKWYYFMAGLLLALMLYKRKNKISWEECLRRFLLRLLRKPIERRRRSSRAKSRTREFYRNN